MIVTESRWTALEVEFALNEECVELMRIGTIEGVRFVDLGFSGVVTTVITSGEA